MKAETASKFQSLWTVPGREWEQMALNVRSSIKSLVSQCEKEVLGSDDVASAMRNVSSMVNITFDSMKKMVDGVLSIQDDGKRTLGLARMLAAFHEGGAQISIKNIGLNAAGNYILSVAPYVKETSEYKAAKAALMVD